MNSSLQMIYRTRATTVTKSPVYCVCGLRDKIQQSLQTVLSDEKLEMGKLVWGFDESKAESDLRTKLAFSQSKMTETPVEHVQCHRVTKMALGLYYYSIQ